MNAEIGGDDVDSAEESETSQSKESVNVNDDSIREFDAPTCSGENVYDIFENQDEIITEDSIIWVNTNKTIWEGKVIKIPYSDLLQDYNYMKLIWINKKKEAKGFD